MHFASLLTKQPHMLQKCASSRAAFVLVAQPYAGCLVLARGRAVAITCGCVHHLSRTYRLICVLHAQIGGFSKMAAMQTKKEMSSQWENISCKSLVASGNQRLLNLRGADDVLLIFQSLRFRIEIITQNRKFCKPFDKIAALVTKIDYVPCFFCASYPWQLRAMERSAGLQGTPKLNRRIRL